jgi:hypothetical protein
MKLGDMENTRSGAKRVYKKSLSSVSAIGGLSL